MNHKKSIHTTLSPENKNKLLIFGKGHIADGIEALIRIAESKTITVTIITKCELKGDS